jgi:flagellar basal body rod protein FlgB
MIRGLFGPSTLPSLLRGGLEEASATQRGISQRVADALAASTTTGFTEASQAAIAKAKQAEADMQREMGSLADTQLRYQADTQLLRGVYQRLKTAIGSTNA